MALVMVTAPYPAGSSASISPPAAVLEMAPAKVLQGAVRLQGLASSPTPDTHVRLACAPAKVAASSTKVKILDARMFNSPFRFCSRFQLVCGALLRCCGQSALGNKGNS